MQNKYYYLVSSLPYLGFEKQPPFAKNIFLAECEQKLTEKDFSYLKKSDITICNTDNNVPEMLRLWQEYNARIRTEMAQLRQAKLSGAHQHMPDELRDIFDEPNPLDAEIAILRKSWDFINSQEYKYNFDLNFIIAYFLKLQIILQKACFDKEKGKEVFHKLTEVTYE